MRHARSGGATCDTTGAHESPEQLCGETNVASFFAQEPDPLGDGFSVEVTGNASGLERFSGDLSRGPNIKVFPQPKIGSRIKRKRCSPFLAGEPNLLGDGFSVDVTDDANGFRRIFRRFVARLKHQSVSATKNQEPH
jgi:hypothetical protein